ncbi:MAG: GNAT family N-acetyltransferase [Sandaracinus sp.]
MITFRALTEADLPLLATWLVAPHVSPWWKGESTLDEVRAEYLPRLHDDALAPLDAPAGVTQYVVLEDGAPIGFCQAYRVMAHQKDGWWLEETDPCALGIDQLIGREDRIGRGVGTEMVRAFCEHLFADPRVTTIQLDPEPENARAIACYRKAGFVEIGPVVTLDGPALLMKRGRVPGLARPAVTTRV